jgi:ABC-type glutathione transport system ATPase component
VRSPHANNILSSDLSLTSCLVYSALDSTSEHAVNSALDQIIRSQNISVILIAHRLATLARAERIVVLENGKITEDGRYSELARRPGGRFRTLMAAQLALEKTRTSDDDEPATESKKVEPVA